MDRSENGAIVSEWRAGYPYVAIGLLGAAIVTFAFLSLGTVMKTMLTETGWRRADVVGVTMVVAVLSLIVAPSVGRLLDRFGARRIALVGAVLFPLAFASAGLATSLRGWWVAWVLIGITSPLISVMTWSHAIAQRFVVGRGLAMGITLSGIGVGNVVVPVVGVFLLERFGWQGVFFGLAGMSFAVLFPLVYFVFHDVDGRPNVERQGAPAALVGFEAREVLRTGRYWRLCVAVLIVAATAGFVNIHLQPMLLESGVTPLSAAAIAVLYGPAQMGSRLLGGFLLDRLPGALVATPLFLAPMVSLLLLLCGVRTAPLVMLVPLLTGIAAGVEMDVAAYFVSRHFGTRAYGALFSTVYAIHAFGYSLAPAVGAWLRDRFGTYDPALIGLLAAIPVAAVIVGTMGRYPASLPGVAAAPSAGAPSAPDPTAT